MAGTGLPPAPQGCRERLTAHYGPSVARWLRTLPELLAVAGQQWALTLTGYHDAGHASAVATAVDEQGRALIVKAWPDPGRYAREVGALRIWYPGSTGLLRATDDRMAMAALLTVGGRPGGAAPPPDETARVAAALHQTHVVGRGVRRGSFPSLADHLQYEVLPRIRRRHGSTAFGRTAGAVLPYLSHLKEDPDRATVLHADLYRENVAFTNGGQPVLLDPLPLEGDSAFDWAFWCVYYQLGRGTEQRLRTAARYSGTLLTRLLPWCLVLCLDGLLYYEEAGDPRVDPMAAVLAGLHDLTRGLPQ